MASHPGRRNCSEESHSGRPIRTRWASFFDFDSLPWNPYKPHKYFVNSDRHTESFDPDLNTDDEEDTGNYEYLICR